MPAPPPPDPSLGPRPPRLWGRAAGLAVSAVALGFGLVGAWAVFVPGAFAGADGETDVQAAVWAAVLVSAVAFGAGVAIVAARALFGDLGGGPKSADPVEPGPDLR